MDRRSAILGCLGVVVAILYMLYLRVRAALVQTQQPLLVWEYLCETPLLRLFVTRIFTMLLKIRNPYTRSIGQNSEIEFSANYADFQVTLLEVGRCQGVLKRSSGSDGPFRSTHGVALSLFAETLAGLAVFSRLGPKGRGILEKVETEFVNKAKGRIASDGWWLNSRGCFCLCRI